MSNPLGSITRVLLPAILVFVAYSFLGPVAGIGILVVFALGYLYFNRALIYQNRAGKKYHNGDFDGALADLRKALSQSPKAHKIRGTYAFLLIKLGHTEEAATEIDKALEGTVIEADKKPLTVTKALVLWKQGKVDEAIKLLEELLVTYENTNVYATLGFLYIVKGDYTKALEFNLRAKEFNGSNPVILDNLGTTYYLCGDFDNAFATYLEVMKNKPNFPEAFYNYARLLDKKGDLEKALYMVRHSLTLRFWNTSTVTKEEIEAYLSELEAKEKAMELEKKENEGSKEPIDNIE